MEGGDVMLVAQVLRDYFQPDAADRVFAQVEKFTSYARTDQPIEKFWRGSVFYAVRRRSKCSRLAGASLTYIFASCAFARRNLSPPKKPC